MNRLEALIRTLVSAGLKLLRREDDAALEASLSQFLRFALVGASSTVVHYAVNVLVLKLLQPFQLSWDYVAGNVVAFLVSVLWSFHWNSRFVFGFQAKTPGERWKTLLKTYVAYGFTGILLTNVLSYVWIDVLGISKYVAPLINLVINTPLNFLINKFWAYKPDPAPSAPDSPPPKAEG